MRIIRAGTPPPEKEWYEDQDIPCFKCGCIFQIDTEDVKCGATGKGFQDAEKWVTVDCPTCKQERIITYCFEQVYHPQKGYVDKVAFLR